MNTKTTILKRIATSIQERVLKTISNDRIRIESVVRNNDPFSGKIKYTTRNMRVETFKTWKTALQLASDSENPNKSELVENYANLLLDNHLSACIDSRVFSVVRSKFKIVNEAGGINEELTSLLQRPWFDDFIKHCVLSVFLGTKLIELTELSDDLELVEINEIPQTNFIPAKGLIVKENGDATGWQYKDGAYANLYIQIGNDKELGDLQNVGPVVISKKLAIGSWLDYIEKFGIPPRWVTTTDRTPSRIQELFDMMIQMISGHVAVLQGDEKIELAQTPGTDANQVFDTLIERCNSEISKRILGATGTIDEKSYVGTAKVHEDILWQRQESDRQKVKYIINKELLPRLVALSPIYSAFQNHKFDWDDSYELEPNELIDKVVALSQYYDIDLEYVTKRTGIPIIGKKMENSTSPPNDGVQKKKPTAKIITRLESYYNSCCSTPHLNLTALDLSKYTKAIDKIAKSLYDGDLKPSDLNDELISHILDDIKYAAYDGLGSQDEQLLYKRNADLLIKLNRNLYEFSGAKCFQELLLFNNKLVDDKGNIRSFADYKKTLQELNLMFNQRYLQVEYDTAIKSAQHAKNWEKFQSQKHLYPNLKYKTVGDAKVRDDHQLLNNIIKPIDDDFWNAYYPPNDWNCRCYVEQTRDKADERQPSVPLKPNFDNNVGKNGVIFTGKHPYFEISEKADKNVKKSSLYRKFKETLELGKLRNAHILAYKSKNGSKVLLSPFADKSFLEQDFEVAKVVADNLGKDVIIRAKLAIEHWKNPEYLIDGVVADRCAIKKLDNVFKDKKKQMLKFIDTYNTQYPSYTIDKLFSIVIDLRSVSSFSSVKYARKVIAQIESNPSLKDVVFVKGNKSIVINKKIAEKGLDEVVKLLDAL